MPEILTLAVPVTKPSVTTYKLLALNLDWGNSRIVVRVQASDLSEPEFTYEGTVASSLLTNLNSANLPVKSLYRRVIERLQADGFLPAGNVTGTPQ